MINSNNSPVKPKVRYNPNVRYSLKLYKFAKNFMRVILVFMTLLTLFVGLPIMAGVQSTGSLSGVLVVFIMVDAFIFGAFWLNSFIVKNYTALTTKPATKTNDLAKAIKQVASIKAEIDVLKSRNDTIAKASYHKVIICTGCGAKNEVLISPNAEIPKCEYCGQYLIISK